VSGKQKFDSHRNITLLIQLDRKTEDRREGAQTVASLFVLQGIFSTKVDFSAGIRKQLIQCKALDYAIISHYKNFSVCIIVCIQVS
jgi:hypothetical protein